MKPLDYLKRQSFSDWAQQRFEENNGFHRKIILFLVKSDRLVWIPCCGFDWTVCYVFDENDRHVWVNGNRYRAILEDYFWPELDGLDISDK